MAHSTSRQGQPNGTKVPVAYRIGTMITAAATNMPPVAVNEVVPRGFQTAIMMLSAV